MWDENWAAVFLDLDGTLVDTEPIHVRAHRRWLASQGIALSEAEVFGNVGKGDEEFYERLIAAHRRDDARVADWIGEKDAIMLRLYATEPVPRGPGVDAFLARLEDLGMPRLVVTSSSRALAVAALAAAGLAGRLPPPICREDVRRPKPAPEPYLLAAERLGVAPAACLVLEDSPVGIRSARAAGCTVVALGGLFTPERQRRAGAHRCVASCAELLGSASPGPGAG